MTIFKSYLYLVSLFQIIIFSWSCTSITNFRKIDIASTIKEINSQRLSTKSNHIPLVINQKVVKFIKLYTNGGRKNLTKILSRAYRYFPMMKKTFRDEGLPEELIYLPIIESGFNASAYSPRHASGPWQFVKYTGKIYGLHSDWWVDERRNVEKSTVAAAKHLKDLYNWLGDWYLALAAYNAGGGKVIRAIKKYKTRDFWKLTRRRWGILRKETADYVPKFLAVVIICENLDKFGFTEITKKPPLLYDVVEIPDATDLEIIAKCCNTTVEEIKKLNPELKRWATPPRYFNYNLRIPYGTKHLFLENFNKIPPEDRITFRRHKIRKGESIWSIASKYKIPRKMILEMNKIKNPQKIRAGDYLIIPIRGLDKAKEIDKMLEKEKISQKYNKLNEY